MFSSYNYLKKTILFFGIVFFVPSLLFSQTFNAPGGIISDYQKDFSRDIFPIEVKGISTRIDSGFGLVKVCVNITHPRVSDLKLQLISPDGTMIWLTNRNGGDKGQDYYNTCFRQNGFNGYIHEAKAPFTGEYIPDSRMEFINNGQNPNGYWYLTIEDLKGEETGLLNLFSISFASNPPIANKSNCDFANPENCICSQTKNNYCTLLPDLVILPKFTQTQIKEYPWNDKNYPGQLRLAASIANIGEGPMEISGYDEWYCNGQKVKKTDTCKNGSAPRQFIYQRIYSKNGTSITGRDTLAGTLYFDNKPGHNHYHVDNWIEMRVIKEIKNKSGKIKRSIIGKSNKVSYCLFDTGICNSDDSLCYLNGKLYGSPTLPNYGLGSFTDCNSGKQGISVGGYDTYGLLYEGQYIQLPRYLKKGFYYVEIEIDPSKKYIESKKSNNIYRQRVYLSLQ